MYQLQQYLHRVKPIAGLEIPILRCLLITVTEQSCLLTNMSVVFKDTFANHISSVAITEYRQGMAQVSS